MTSKKRGTKFEDQRTRPSVLDKKIRQPAIVGSKLPRPSVRGRKTANSTLSPGGQFERHINWVNSHFR